MAILATVLMNGNRLAASFWAGVDIRNDLFSWCVQTEWGLSSHVVPVCAAAAVCCCLLPPWAESSILEELCLHPDKRFPLISQMNLIFVLLQYCLPHCQTAFTSLQVSGKTFID